MLPSVVLVNYNFNGILFSSALKILVNQTKTNFFHW